MPLRPPVLTAISVQLPAPILGQTTLEIIMYVKLNSRFNAAPMLGRGFQTPSKRANSAQSALRILLLGPPGSGKGTQAGNICSRYDLVHVSTGDILRRNTQEGTELGMLAKACMLANVGQCVDPGD